MWTFLIENKYYVGMAIMVAYMFLVTVTVSLFDRGNKGLLIALLIGVMTTPWLIFGIEHVFDLVVMHEANEILRR